MRYTLSVRARKVEDLQRTSSPRRLCGHSFTRCLIPALPFQSTCLAPPTITPSDQFQLLKPSSKTMILATAALSLKSSKSPAQALWVTSTLSPTAKMVLRSLTTSKRRYVPPTAMRVPPTLDPLLLQVARTVGFQTPFVRKIRLTYTIPSLRSGSPTQREVEVLRSNLRLFLKPCDSRMA